MNDSMSTSSPPNPISPLIHIILFTFYSGFRGHADVRSEWSSFNENFPRVIAQTYLFDHTVKYMTSTTTRHGITSRDLLVATTNQLIALPKRLLDPRRPVVPKGGKLKGDDKEEGLVPYDSVIPDERKWTISHINEVLIPYFLSTDILPRLNFLLCTYSCCTPETEVDNSYSESQKS